MTGIPYCDETWSVVTGCTKVSAGCKRCWAERMLTTRLRHVYPEGFNPTCHPEKLLQPFHWKKPRRVFVAPMGDLFHEAMSDDQIKRVLRIIATLERHPFLVLTKRPKRMRSLVMGYVPIIGPEPPTNLWLGVSVENQQAADERIPLLLETPAAHRWISAEPLLGPIWLGDYPNIIHGIDWVVAGGESGTGFRPDNADWYRCLRDECQAADIPFYFKQRAALRPGTDAVLDGVEWKELPVCTPQKRLA